MAKLFGFAPTMLKNLFSTPVTKNYPAEPAVYPERSRGHIEIDESKCVLCGLCMRNCPSGAIKVDRAGKTWSINAFDCVQCAYCTTVCAKKALTIVPGYQTPGREKKEKIFDIPYTPPVRPAVNPAAAKAAAAKAAAAKAAAAKAAAANAAATPATSAAVSAPAATPATPAAVSAPAAAAKAASIPAAASATANPAAPAATAAVNNAAVPTAVESKAETNQQ